MKRRPARTTRLPREAKPIFHKSLLKTTVIAFCSIGFIWNSFHTISSFSNGDKITSIALKSLKEQVIDYPALAVCSSRAFKNPTSQLGQMVSLDDYRNNTFDPDEYILDVFFGDPHADNQSTAIGERVTTATKC